MSSNGNSNYTQIHAHGTPSALEPSFIAQSSMVGPSGSPVIPQHPYETIDVNVSLVGAVAGQLFVLGEAIAPGCVVTSVSFNAGDTLEAAVVVSFGVAEPLSGSTVPTVYTNIQSGTAAAVPGVAGGDLNGGQAFVGLSTAVPVFANDGPMYPVLQVTTPITDPMAVGDVSVKVVYFCP
jgi:hypothetical protein